MLPIISLIISLVVLAAAIRTRSQYKKSLKACEKILKDAEELHANARRMIKEPKSDSGRFFQREFTIPSDFASDPEACIELHKEALLNEVRALCKENLSFEEIAPGEFKVFILI